MTTPTANWNTTTINGVQYLVIETALFYVPLDFDPSSNMFIAVAAPNAGVPIGLGNFPALLQGPPGASPSIDATINFTALAYTDSTPDSASWTNLGSNLYQLNLALHVGEPGADGTMAILSASDLAGAGSQTPGQILVVNPAGNGFVFQSQRVGDRYVPGTIAAVPSGNPAYTLCPVTIGAQPFDWRPDVGGFSILTPTGTDVSVDLIARLSNANPDGGATTGNEVGRAIGLPMSAGTPVSQSLFSGPPPGSADSYDRVPKGQSATIFFRAERQTGSDTFTTTAATTRFRVRVAPCPTDIS